jgi:hypothetical protein
MKAFHRARMDAEGDTNAYAPKGNLIATWDAVNGRGQWKDETPRGWDYP